MHDSRFDDDDQDETNDLDVAADDASEDEDPEAESPYTEEEFGEFAELLNSIREWRARAAEVNAELGLTGNVSEADAIPLETLEDNARSVLENGSELDEQMPNLPEDSAATWQKVQRQLQRESALRRKLELLSVGLTSSMIGDLADDANHLLEDSCDSEGRELRKDLRRRMSSLSRRERQNLIRQLLADGRIDQDQFSRLMVEFM